MIMLFVDEVPNLTESQSCMSVGYTRWSKTNIFRVFRWISQLYCVFVFLLAVTVIVSPQFSHLYFPSNLDDVSIPRDYAKQTCFLTLRHTAVLNLCSASYFVKNCIVILFTCAAPVCILHTLYMYLSIYLILYVSSVILDISICIIYIYVSFYNQEIVYSSLESLLSLFGYLNICAD